MAADDSDLKPVKPLLSLDDCNRERWKIHQNKKLVLKSHKSGFGCPRCREELWIRDPHLIFGGVHDLADEPLQRELYCPKCMLITVQLL